MNEKIDKLRKSNSQFYTVSVRTFVIPFYYGSGLSISDPHLIAHTDPAPQKSGANLQPLAYRPSMAQY